MYQIYKNGVLLAEVESPFYIKYGNYGSLTPATEADAIGVAYASVAYNLEGHTEIAGAETVTLVAPGSGPSKIRLVDDTTGTVFVLGIDNGKLYVEEEV